MLPPNPSIPAQQQGAIGTMPPQGPAAQGMMMPPQAAPPTVLHDVVVVRSKKQANVKIEPVPPEEFGISRNARSIRDCNYCFHKVLKSEGDLIAQGFDKAQIKAIPTYTNITNTEETQRDTVNEYQYTGDEGNQTARRIEVTEHYIRMDYEGNDKPCLYKVTTGGHQSLSILKKNGKLDIEECDAIPFAAMTPVIQTHRFFGRSIADLVMDIQRIKTAILRGVLDNVYLANNPRVEVPESHATAETLDDLLVSRPGGIVRTRLPDGLKWQEVPSVAAGAFPVIEYMDTTREIRTGVTRQGQGVGADALQNQSATAVNQVFTAAQARIRLIARIFAETGIRDLFQLVHATIRKHGDEQKVVRLRNQWVTVDPREWKTRYDMTIHVGLGQGSKSERLAHVMSLATMQKELLLGGKTNIVSDKNLYNTTKEATKLLGLPNVDDHFTDPSTQPPPQQAPDPKLMIEQLKAHNAQQIAQMKQQGEQQQAQLKAQLELQAQQSDAHHQIIKAQADIALAHQKAEFQAQLALLQHDLKVRETEADIAVAHAKAAQGIIHERQKAAKESAKEPQKPDTTAVLAQHLANHTQMMGELMKHVTAPKKVKVVRDAQGRVSHTEPMLQ